MSSFGRQLLQSLLVVLLGRDEPMILAEAAVLFEEAGMAPAQEALASLPGYGPQYTAVAAAGLHAAGPRGHTPKPRFVGQRVR